MLSATFTPSQRIRFRARPRTHYTDSLRTLQAEFRRRGWHRPATGTLLLQWAVLLGLSFGGMAVFFLATSVLLQAVGMLLAGFGALGLSTQAHTASHGAVSRKKRFNRLLTYFGYPLLLGLPTTFWRHKHIATHHHAPNIDGYDDDINLMPLFAMTDEQAMRGGPLARFYYRRVQWLAFLLAIPFIALNTMAYAYVYLARKLVRKPTPAAWIDLGCLAGHGLLWIGLPLLFFPAGTVLLAYFLRVLLLGAGMFAVFAPAHFPHEALMAAPSQRHTEFVLRQTATTVNFRTGPIGRFLCAGVDFQIEHHLFAGFSHVYYPQMSILIREFCERHGYPYHTLGWGEALWKSLVVFLRPKPLVHKLTGPEA
jgi:fatty acid desaturase